MQVTFKMTKNAGMNLLSAMAEAASERDYWSYTSVDWHSLTATHKTSSGYTYLLEVKDSHAILTYKGSRSSLANGSRAIYVFALNGKAYVSSPYLTRERYLHHRNVGRYNFTYPAKVVSVSSSLPEWHSARNAPFADDMDVFAELEAKEREERSLDFQDYLESISTRFFKASSSMPAMAL